MEKEAFMKICNKLKANICGACLFSFLSSIPTYSAIVAYPEKGQSEKQKSTDMAKCEQWATQQTGIDPETLLQESQAPGQAAPKGGAVRGGAKGAAVGALGGAIGGDAGKGAAIGAGVGAAGGAASRARGERQAAQQQEQAKAQIQQQLASYEKAQKACLEGKGYSVS
jgi:hypothetical protein